MEKPGCPQLDHEIDRVSNLYDEFERLDPILRTDDYVVPVNLRSERHRFFDAFKQAGTIIVPEFEYQPLNERSEALRLLEDLLHRCEPLGSLAAQRLAQSLSSEMKIRSDTDLHDAASVTERTEQIFGRPTADLVTAAEDFLAAEDAEATEGSLHAAESVAAQVKQVFEQLELSRWSVEVSSRMSARMSVNGAIRRLRIRSDSLFSEAEVNRLLVHEIGTHVARHEAGARQRARFLRGGSVDYLEAEEGLACYNEDHYKVATQASFRTYAGRVIAADAALKGGFVEIIERLLDALGAERAFDIAVRAKRGFSDLGTPGAHLKDTVYLRGYLRVKAMTDEQGAPDRRLSYGKVSFSDFKLIDELAAAGLLIEPPYTAALLAELVGLA